MNNSLMTRRRALVLPLAAVGLTVASARAHDGHEHEEATPDASPEASPAMMMSEGTGTGAVYLEILNTGAELDRLVSATTDAAVTVEIHTMLVEDGVMTMRELEDGIELPPGETVILDPSNLHVMLIDLNYDLTPGLTFDLSLMFEVAGEVTVPVLVTSSAPTDEEPVQIGDLELAHIWSRPAPMLSPVATPEG